MPQVGNGEFRNLEFQIVPESGKADRDVDNTGTETLSNAGAIAEAAEGFGMNRPISRESEIETGHPDDPITELPGEFFASDGEEAKTEPSRMTMPVSGIPEVVREMMDEVEEVEKVGMDASAAGILNEHLQVADPETQEIIDRSLQGIRVLSELWDRRFAILEEFFHERNKRRVHVFKKKEDKINELSEFLEKLRLINEREETVAEILGRGSSIGAEMLRSFPQPTEEEFEDLDDEEQKLVLMVPVVRRILVRYSELSAFHKDILDSEREMIESHEDLTMELYMQRLSLFRAEFEILNRGTGEIAEVRDKFQSIRLKHNKSERLRQRGKPIVYVKESGLATAAVTAMTHFTSTMVLGGSAETTPVYWKLTALAAGVTAVVNFVDFYFKFFSAATDKLRIIEDKVRHRTRGKSESFGVDD